VPACAHCKTEYPEAPRRGKTKLFCGAPCRVAAGNARRATTRTGRTQGITNPRSGQPVASGAITIPPTPSTPLSDLPSLLAKAHSRVGVTAWEIATIAKLKGVSAWAPLSVILGKEAP
jgi:hypothetical protein